MILTMGVSLYTSRIVLNTLGVEDFGIYNLVGGVVIMFSFLNASMSSSTQRFISFELGKKDYTQLKKVFSMSVNIHAIIAAAILILAETIGLWFLNVKLVIPAERMDAANLVYQFSILSLILSVMRVPYNATIIAYERMNIYAYVSIVEVVLKLIIVFALVWLGFDKLKMYSILIFSVAAMIWLIYWMYCKRNFTVTNYIIFWEKSLYKTMINFAGWYLFGSMSIMTIVQGANVILNLFFGPVVNAAWAISFQLNNAVSLFSNNIRMAANPQIVKSYAAGDDKYMKTLIFESAKYSFYLLLLISLPILLETATILRIWLKIVPDYTVLFCQLVLTNLLLQCFDTSFAMAFQAIGRIKENQILSGGTYLILLPIAYILLKLGYPPQTVFYVQIAGTIIVAFIVKVLLLRKLVGIPILDYFHRLILPVFKVSAIAVILPIFIRFSMSEGIWRLLMVGFASFTSVAISTYYLGLNKATRIKIQKFIFSQFARLKR